MGKEELNLEIDKEKSDFEKYVSSKNTSIKAVIDKYGQENFDNIIFSLAVMRDQIDEAAKFAKKKDQERVAYFLGAHAKKTKDNIYGIMMQASGGQMKVIETGLTCIDEIVKDYIMQKFDGGVNRCDFLLNLN